jgi:cobalamin 5'-phosphate synthase/cobalamin synthase
VTVLLAAVQFLLVSPAFVRRPFTAQELGRSTAFYPLVGLLLGALLVAADSVLHFVLPVGVRSALVLALWMILTGALHFDGFLDTCDGLLGAGTPQRRMEIMRDERTGAFALAAGVLILLIMFTSLDSLGAVRWAALLLAPVLGRWGMTIAVVALPYARTAGLGRDIKEHTHAAEATIATIIVLLVVAALSWSLRGVTPLAALASAALMLWLSTRYVLSRIPGMTGDTYGAVNTLIEAAVLLTFVAVA